MNERLGRLLSMTGKVAKESFDSALGAVGSSLTVFIILGHVDGHPGLSQRQLAGILGIEGPTLTHHLDRLTSDGLLRRVPHPDDRRAYCVELTPEGKAHLDRVMEYADQLDAQFRTLFSPEELDVFVRLLRRVFDYYTREDNVDHAAG